MLKLVLYIAAGICFAVAVLVAVGAIATNYDGWLAGGLLAWLLATLVPGAVVYPSARPPAPPAQ